VTTATTFFRLLSGDHGARPPLSVLIPLYQRDYAQGREDPRAERVRREFVAELYRAVTGREPLVLDFVFGGADGADFVPLDGQQRLTTLFLLHWYLSSRAGAAGAEVLARFSYATRASARAFCTTLVRHVVPDPCDRVSDWIRDQPWFLSLWTPDPTVRGMLVVLDEIHTRFRDLDAKSAWARLTDQERPAVSFFHLGIEGMGDADGLYIRMNSRGRPLTDFEIFKARFGRALASRGEEFATKIDGAWADMLWKHRGDDDLIDDELLRYVELVTECCEWREDLSSSGTLEDRTILVFAGEDAEERLDRLFQAFDLWCTHESAEFFRSHIAINRHEPGKVTLFSLGAGSVGDEDLFATACRLYGEMAGAARRFSLQRTLLFDAVLTHLTHRSGDFARRLRTLRNLTEAARLEAKAMGPLLLGAERFVVEGDLAVLADFPRAQVMEEQEKATFLAASPGCEAALQALEDHSLLRGCLAAFVLDATRFEARAEAFGEVFSDPGLRPLVAAALLACGDYSQSRAGRGYLFGTHENDEAWRTLFDVGCDRPSMQEALGALLERYALATGSPEDRLRVIADAYLRACASEQRLDWRYYFVKYPAMRTSRSGNYVWDGESGYSLCMLHGVRLSGFYQDPYLEAVLGESRAKRGDDVGHPRFTGPESEPRWLRLSKSHTGLRFVPDGIVLEPPAEPRPPVPYDAVVPSQGGPADRLRVPQRRVGEELVDETDRVIAGAALLSKLIAAGL